MDKEEIIMMLLGDKNNESPYKIGENYLIRTVTMIYTGKLKKEYKDSLVFSECAWIPETERWHNTVKDCIFKEVEPYVNDVIISKGAILDVTVIDTLPKDQK